ASAADTSRARNSSCRVSSPLRHSSRLPCHSVRASLALARTSPACSAVAPRAVRIRSRSTSAGARRPVSILLILLCDMEQRRANRSPERPAVRRNSRSICPSSPEAAARSSGSRDTLRLYVGRERDTRLDRDSLPLPIDDRVLVDEFAVDLSAVRPVVEPDDPSLIEQPKIEIRNLQVRLRQVENTDVFTCGDVSRNTPGELVPLVVRQRLTDDTDPPDVLSVSPISLHSFMPPDVV